MSTETLHPQMDIDACVQQGLNLYPDFPYHNRQHGLDVIKATREQAVRCGFDTHHAELLTVAAAWHDAGFGHDEELWRPHGGKEVYAVFLMKQAVDGQYRDEDVAFIERAIMGTMMGPNVKRDTPEAKFLHLMDLSYLWADQKTFLKGARAVWEEEFSHLDTEQFLDLQHAFLPSYRDELVEFMTERRVSDDDITEMTDKIDANKAAIIEYLKKTLSDARVGATAVITAMAS